MIIFTLHLTYLWLFKKKQSIDSDNLLLFENIKQRQKNLQVGVQVKNPPLRGWVLPIQGD